MLININDCTKMDVEFFLRILMHNIEPRKSHVVSCRAHHVSHSIDFHALTLYGETGNSPIAFARGKAQVRFGITIVNE